MSDALKTFKKADVPELYRKLAGATILGELVRKITAATEQTLRESLMGMPAITQTGQGILTKADIPHVTLRTETLRTMLRAFSETQNFEQVLRKLGTTVGTDFAANFSSFLRKINTLPEDYEALLDFWAFFDSSAGMGLFIVDEFNEKEKKLSIRLKNSFLVDESRDHDLCPFMAGYMCGFVNEALAELKIYLDIYTKLRVPSDITPISNRITHKSYGPRECLFEIPLVERKHTEAYKELFRAIKEFDDRDYRRVLERVRLALDYAVKKSLGLDVGDRGSFYKLTNAIRDRKYDLPFDASRKAYDLASKVVHQSIEPTEIEARRAIESARDFILASERLSLKEGDIKEIIDQTREG